MAPDRIGVFIADDNLLVREGVRALVEMHDDLAIAGVAGDYDGLVAGAEEVSPQVLVTDIRMPPDFVTEGIDAAREVRKRHPAIGVVILSQYDDPDYAVSLLSDGAAGYAYLLKDRVAEGGQLAKAIRAVATGGSMLDPLIVDALVTPFTDTVALTPADESLLRMIAEGRHVKAIAATVRTTPEAIADAMEKLFLRLAQDASAGGAGALRHLKMLQRAIVEREQHGEMLSRLMPGGVAEKLRHEGQSLGETEKLTVTVLMSDVRGYSAIAERTYPAALAAQLNEHRAEMCDAIMEQGGTVMHFIGDAIMGVFGAPLRQEDHADRAVSAASAMHIAQGAVNRRWEDAGLPPFPLGIGLSTGEVAAAVLGSERRLEYSVVGDSVNLAQRLQQWAECGETVMSDRTFAALRSPAKAEALGPAHVKGRKALVTAYKLRSVAS